MDVIVDRVAGLDVHQKSVMAAVRTPGKSGGRAQEIKEFRTYTGDLVALRDELDLGGHVEFTGRAPDELVRRVMSTAAQSRIARVRRTSSSTKPRAA